MYILFHLPKCHVTSKPGLYVKKLIEKNEWFDFWKNNYAVKCHVQNPVQCEYAFTKHFY